MAVDKLVDSTQLDSDLTSVANAIRAKSGGSSQLAFPAGFVSEIQAIPSGGGGITKIADGTFTGAGNYIVDLSIGKKMPQTNFWFRLWLTPSSVLANAEKYSAIGLFFTVYNPDKYDLSTDGKKRPTTTYSFSTDYNGDTTVCGPVLSRETAVFYRYSRTESAQIVARDNAISITKSSAGFTVTPTLWNPNNLYASGLTYNWEIVYFGNDPTNDIVEVP